LEEVGTKGKGAKCVRVPEYKETKGKRIKILKNGDQLPSGERDGKTWRIRSL
jgi:hypothetical protein